MGLKERLGLGPYGLIESMVGLVSMGLYYSKNSNNNDEKPHNKKMGYSEDWNELFVNAHENNLEKVKEIISQLPDSINFKDSKGFDLLQVAVYNNSVQVFEYLITERSSDFNINHQNNRNVNILHFVAINGYEEIFDIMIKNNKVPNVDLLTSDNESALFLAAANVHFETFEKLLNIIKSQSPEKLKSIINTENVHKTTALTLCVIRSDLHSIKLLIENGANVNATRKDGSTALHVACSIEDPSTEIIKLLLDNGADATIENTFGWSSLHQAYNNKDFPEKYQFISNYLSNSNKAYLDSFDPEKKKVIPKQE